MKGFSRPLALTAVSATGAAGCARLFGDAGWVVPVFAAVAGAHAVGALTRRWSVRAGCAAQGAGLFLLLAEAVGGHTASGIPTPATLTALGRAVDRAPEALRAAITPAPTTPELILLVVTGLWLASAVADGLAHRRRAGLLAVLPLVVFPIVVAALGTDRLRTTLTFAFAAATALYAALDRAAALPGITAQHLRPAPASARRALVLSARPRAAGHRRAGGLAGPALVAGVAAVVLGPMVPGVGAGGGRRARLRGHARRVAGRAQPDGRHQAAAAGRPPDGAVHRSGHRPGLLAAHGPRPVRRPAVVAVTAGAPPPQRPCCWEEQPRPGQPSGTAPCSRTSTSPPSTRRGSRRPTRRSASRRPAPGSTRRPTRW